MLTVPPSAGGMHLVGWLPAGIDDREVSRVARARGIAVTPLSFFSERRPQQNGLLRGYAGSRRHTSGPALSSSPRSSNRSIADASTRRRDAGCANIDAFRSHGGLYNPVPLANAKRSTDPRDRALVTVAVTGANSGVGRILVRHLADRSDTRVVACVRARRSAMPLPSSERVSVQVIDYDDPNGLASGLTGSNCVVHLAGILFESPSSSYQTANVAATQAVTDACKALGLAHLVLVSALGADPGSTNRYLRSKGEAERIVADSGLAATIIRTPILLGPGMAGARAVVHAASRRSVALLGGGRHAIRPLDVDDLSRAIVRCCDTAPTGSVTIHELVGPESTTYRDVVARTAALLGHEVSIRSMPIWLAKLGAALAGWTRRGGMTPAVIDVITASEVVRANADVALGVTLTPLSATLRKLLTSEPEGTCARS